MGKLNMKFCKDCKHCKIGKIDRYECRHPNAGWWVEPSLDLATGEQDDGLAHAAMAMRRPGKECGPEARWFEPKEE